MGKVFLHALGAVGYIGVGLFIAMRGVHHTIESERAFAEVKEQKALDKTK